VKTIRFNGLEAQPIHSKMVMPTFAPGEGVVLLRYLHQEKTGRMPTISDYFKNNSLEVTNMPSGCYCDAMGFGVRGLGQAKMLRVLSQAKSLFFEFSLLSCARLHKVENSSAVA
jgi:hypothetical protein